MNMIAILSIFILLLWQGIEGKDHESFHFKDYYEKSLPKNYAELIDPLSQQFSCIHYLVNYTQSCNNRRHRYFITPLGVSQGFTSEFAFNYAYSFLNSVVIGARLIETTFPSRKWEYDCPKNKGWQCYFASSPCEDRYLDSKSLNFAFYETFGRLHMNHIQLNREMNRDFTFFHNKLNNFVNDHHIKEDLRDETASKVDKLKAKCKLNALTEEELLGVVYQYLFQLSEEAIEKINHLLNNELKSFQALFQSSRPRKTKDVLGIHLRTTDKKYEMSADEWNFITNADRIIAAVKPELPPATNLKNVFVATDNCTLACEFREKLRGGGASSLEFIGACYARNICSEKTVEVHNPRDIPPEKREMMNYELLLELYLLSQSTVFFGLESSNIPRFVNKVRHGKEDLKTIFFKAK
eukprot:gene10668-11619_t